MHQPYASVISYMTKDGSEIRELMHPAVQGNQNQSLAEATIPVGGKTYCHRHLMTEELYHVTQGQGRMHLDAKVFDVAPGDTICIAPGTHHWVENIGAMPLVILCCCSPAYTHNDTFLADQPAHLESP